MADRLNVVLHSGTDASLADALSSVATVLSPPGLAVADVTALLGEADALVSARFTRAMAVAAPRLRLLHTPGAGTDGIDLQAVPAAVTLCNVYGHEAGIAEYVLMTMLALNRELFQLDRTLRRGDWSSRVPQRELRGRLLAIVGLGHIGARVASYARTLGMTVAGVTRNPDAACKQTLELAAIHGLSELHAALPDADFVVLAVPLTPETQGLIGETELGAMKGTAYLINVARGGVIDERALYTALREGRIAGAAIDAWYRYPAADEHCPPASLPFHELDNIIMTPHVAGLTDGTLRHRWAEITENIRRLSAGGQSAACSLFRSRPSKRSSRYSARSTAASWPHLSVSSGSLHCSSRALAKRRHS